MAYRNLVFPPETRILVTGGAGFIGSNLCEVILEMGIPVRCLDDFSTGKKENLSSFQHHPSFQFMEGDIRSFETCLEACDGMTHVLHQAAWGSVPRSIQRPLDYEAINIRGTLNMMEAARQKGIRRFVYASSSSVYGDHPALPKREEVVGHVLSPYALTKKTNEEYGRIYAELYGIETVGLRYFNVFGRRQDPDGPYAAVIPRFIRALLRDEAPILFGDGNQSRDFTYIDNVIEANLKACLAPSVASGQVFNVACGSQVTLLELCDILERLLGKSIPPVFAPPRSGDILHSNADISKARDLLGYDPEYDFERGIALAVEWYRQSLE